MSRGSLEWIFGYGSLLAAQADDHPAPTPAVLRGHRRRWDVAMDNEQTIPGYKAFVDPDSREQPPVFVTFLNIQPDAEAWVNGVLMPVRAFEVASLDARERNYERHEVTQLVDVDGGGRIWAYVGSGGGRRRYRTGRARGTAVVSSEYLAHVEAGFASFGPRMLDHFRLTTDPPEVPLVPLLRVDVAPA